MNTQMEDGVSVDLQPSVLMMHLIKDLSASAKSSRALILRKRRNSGVANASLSMTSRKYLLIIFPER